MGVSFFGSKYLLNHFRQKDDIYNSVVAGSTTGMIMGMRHGPKRALPLVVLGGFSGYMYTRMGTAIYNVTRRMWLSHRVELEYEAPKSYSQSRRIPPPRENVPEKYRFEEWNSTQKSKTDSTSRGANTAVPRIDDVAK